RRHEPVHLMYGNFPGAEGRPRADHDARIGRIERQNEKRFGFARYPQSLALTYREVNHAWMAAEHAPAFVDDLARPGRARRKMVDHTRIIAVGHEADVLAVRLFRDSESKVRGQRTH